MRPLKIAAAIVVLALLPWGMYLASTFSPEPKNVCWSTQEYNCQNGW